MIMSVYSEIIDFLATADELTKKRLYKEVALVTAKEQPEFFVEILTTLRNSKRISNVGVNPNHEKLRTVLKGRGKVEAIKECRKLYNLGLKDAKTYIENNIE